MTKATDAIVNGMTGFLQTKMNKEDLNDYDRQEVVSFLSGEQTGEYAPKSGEIYF